MEIKQAIILAGGNSGALKVFETAKPLIKVGDKPLLISTIERLERAGISDIVIVSDIPENSLCREVLGYGKRKATIRYRDISRSRSMVETLVSVSDEVEKNVIVTMSDLIFGGEVMKKFVKEIRPKDSVALLVSRDGELSRLSGATGKLYCSDDQKLIPRTSDTSVTTVTEAGVYYFTKPALKKLALCIKEKNRLKTFGDVLTACGEKLPAHMIDIGKQVWFDINVPADVIRAELFLRKQRNGEKPKGHGGVPKTKSSPKPQKFLYTIDIKFDVHMQRGLLQHFEDYEIIPYGSYYSPHFVVVDKNIDELYGELVVSKLRHKGYIVHKLLVDPGEWSKGMDTYNKLVNEILTIGIDKKSTIISVGGGVIKDLAGHIASTLYRGIGFIAIPTTVLSQCDAAIGPKQGINGSGGKNLIGSYHAPLKVIVDPDVLKTLDRRYVADGLAECLKQSFAQDVKLFEFFHRYKGDIQDIHFLNDVLKKSIALKIDSFQKDYYEEKEALANQYGHEIGHAIEFLSGFQLAHGESVAIGMRVSAEIATILGILDKQVRDEHIELLKRYELPVVIPQNIKPQDIIDALRFHKKSHSNAVRMVLITKTGKMWSEGGAQMKECGESLILKGLLRSYG